MLETQENHGSIPLPKELAQLAPQLETARETLVDLNARLILFARERPVVALATALAAGFVLGKLVSRI